MSRQEIAIGSRGSPLALAQARLVVEAFKREGQPSHIVIIRTEGDRRAPDTAWGEGAFVAAIERVLLSGRIDIAVHSAKDVPTDEDPRLRIGAYLPRADPRDALVVRHGVAGRAVDDLPAGCRVGTDSPRRTGFLLARRPDLVLHPLHGNVDSRLKRLDGGETDALVLACAGLDRLGLGDRISERIAPEVVPPAPGQGAVAVQIRSDDTRMLVLAEAIDHPPTRAAVEAERAFLAASGGGCRAPIGALAELVDQELVLLGGLSLPDGSAAAVGRRRGPSSHATRLARELSMELETRVRGRPWAAKQAADGAASSRRVIVTRAATQARELAQELIHAGLEPVLVPAIAVELGGAGGELDGFVRRLAGYTWVVITSGNGARAVVDAAARTSTRMGTARYAAVGSVTRRMLEAEGIEIAFQPSRSSAVALAEELPLERGDRVLAVRGDLADREMAATLAARGALVDDVVAYRTREAPVGSRALLRAALAAGPVGAVLFTSGSTVRGLVALGRAESIDVRAWSAVCIGPETAEEARANGFRILAVSPRPDPGSFAAVTARSLVPRPQEVQ